VIKSSIKKSILSIFNLCSNHWYFQLFVIVVLASALSPFTKLIYNTFIYLTVPWGGYLILLMIVKYRPALSFDMKLALLFLMFGSLSVLMSSSEYFLSNGFVLGFNAVYFFVFFLGAEEGNYTSIRKNYTTIAWILIWWTLLLSSLSILLFLFKAQGIIEISHMNYIIGIAMRSAGFIQLVGAYTAVSSLAVSASMSIILSITLMLINNKSKKLLIINLIVQIITLAWSNNLTALFALLASVVVISTASFYGVCHQRVMRNQAICFIVSALLGIIVSFLVLGAVQCIAKTGDYYQKDTHLKQIRFNEQQDISDSELINEISKINEDEIVNESHINNRNEKNNWIRSPEERPIIGSFATLTGRIRIFEAALQKWRSRWLLGHSYKGISIEFESGDETVVYYNTHNGYLSVLLANGILGFIIFIIFISKFVIIAIKRFFSQRYSSLRTGLLAFIAYTLVYNLSQSQFIMERSLIAFLTFIFMGYVKGIDSLENEMD